MNNTINLDYRTRAYHNIRKTYEAQNKAKPDSAFVRTVLEKSMESENVSQSGTVADVSAKDMTMEEYKQYIYDEISEMYVHPSQSNNTVCIHITDAGFEAMKNDLEYEKWVLGIIRDNFSFYNPWGPVYGASYSVEYFGATKEEHRGYSWNKSCQNSKSRYDKSAVNSFWERRKKRKKLLKKQQEEYLNKKAREKRRMQEKLLESAAIERKEKARLMQPWNAEQMSYASAAYEASLTAKIMKNSILKG